MPFGQDLDEPFLVVEVRPWPSFKRLGVGPYERWPAFRSRWKGVGMDTSHVRVEPVRVFEGLFGWGEGLFCRDGLFFW